jgi:sigma-B regulation protein RsbU (phosphoserine phosphatase)
MNSLRREERVKKNILIVDDTPNNLHLLSQMLSERGYKVRAVLNGERALAAAQRVAPDLILLDVRMPEMDGYEVCERLKGDERTHDVPVIFISALNEIQDKIRGFSVGGVDYVTKPFQMEEVLVRVETQLMVQDLQRQLQEANQRFQRELALAGEVQRSFLPAETPRVPGWEIAVILQPARETSGDFYDVLELPGGRLGLLIADVVDKGAGAALYMALSATLFRTYATDYPDNPQSVVDAVNCRVLLDTTARQFVTAFYGVLDPETGTLTYCNAGHVPPYLVGDAAGDDERLLRTGVPLGLFEGQTWEQKSVAMAPGDVLVLYTDGVTEAQSRDGRFFDAEALLASVRAHRGAPAAEMCEALLAAIDAFTEDAPRLDDIALLILKRAD